MKITVEGQTYERVPLKTHLISDRDDILKVIESYTKNYDSTHFIVVSERVVAISQGRSFLITDIHPGWWAKKLYPFVHNHPGGIGLRDPHTMQLAIQEAGVPRILFAALVAAITKPFGLRGMFYRVAGNNINAIDGPCDYTLPPGNKSAKLGPKDPEKVAQQAENLTKKGVVIIDANDYGVNILGMSKQAKSSKIPFGKVFKDNPMGQTDEQTPIVLVKKLS